MRSLKKGAATALPYLPFALKCSGMMTITHDYHYICEDAVLAEKFHNDLYQTMTDPSIWRT